MLFSDERSPFLPLYTLTQSPVESQTW